MIDSQHEFYNWILWAPIPQFHILITPIPMYFLWASMPQYPTGTRPACRGGEGWIWGDQRNYILLLRVVKKYGIQ